MGFLGVEQALFRVFPAVLTAVLTAGVLIAGAPAGAEPAGAEPAAAAAASTFTPRSPVRVLDTRTGVGGVSGAVPARGTITVSLAAQVPANATAVVLNVTGVSLSANTYVTVFPAGITRPATSNLNLPAGDTRANQVTVTLGTDRRLSLYNEAGNTHLVADLAGYYGTGAGAGFTALPPNRVLDTRQSGPRPGPGTTRVVDLTGHVPESATAVTFNLTAVGPTAPTYVTAWPTGSARPTASNVNLPAGETRPNLVTVAVGPGQQVSLYNDSGSTNLIVDLTGFYTPEYGAAFLPLAPERVLDTRNGTGVRAGPVGPDQAVVLDLIGKVPAAATGVAMNLTGLGATAPTVVTAWEAAGDVPLASTLNLVPGRAIPNAAVIAFGSSRMVSFHNNAGSVHLLGDLAGVFVVADTAPCGSDCAYGWGANYDRGLGNGDIDEYSSVPRPVVSLSGVREVTGSSGTGYALLADGTVRAWGSNQSGRLGNGWGSDSYGHSAVPVPVVGLTDVTAIEARGSSAYALRADGTVWAWGENYSGQLGNGTLVSSAVPVRVSGLTDVTAIGAGDVTGYAVRADGTLWAWGSNGGGHLGTGSTAERSTTPVRLTALSGIVEVAGGGHSNGTYALAEDGTVWSWGYNFLGALGTGEYCEPGVPCLSRVPVRVTGLTDVTAVRSGVYNGLALRADGTVWMWGTNGDGALGNGVECEFGAPETCSSATPSQVADLDDVTALASFHRGGYALRADGTVWSWGLNYQGALGNDTVTDHTTVPVQVQSLSGVTGLGNGSNAGYAITPTP